MAFKNVFGRNEIHETANTPVLKYIVKHWSKYESKIVKNDEKYYDYNPKTTCQKYLASFKKTIAIK